MQTILLIIQVLAALAIIGLVLLQQGKGADAGAAFGSGASGTVFGSRGTANFLSRATGVLAAVFFATSLGLAYLVQGGGANNSVIDQLQSQPKQTQTAPAEQTPAPPAKSSSDSTPAQGDTSQSSPAPSDVPAAAPDQQTPSRDTQQ